MMHGISGGMGVGAWLMMAVVWVALIAVIVWAVATLVGRARPREDWSDARERPEEILDRRLASGEIDAATYDTLRGKLRGAQAARG